MSKYKEKDAIEDKFTNHLCSILNLDKSIFKKKHNEVCVDDEQYLYIWHLINETQYLLNCCASKYGYRNNRRWCNEVVNMFFNFVPKNIK